MDYELALTESNRIRLAEAFQNNKRVDYSIDCAIEGQMGKAFVDHLDHPTAYRITGGLFWYFAGDARSPGGVEMMRGFPAYNLLMPSPPEWIELAKEMYGERLRPFARYSFSTEKLCQEPLEELLRNSKHRDAIVPIDEELAARLAGMPESYFELSDYNSVKDFVDRGIGYAVKENDEIKGVAYSSLVCSKGIEVSLYVEEKYRQQGVATALGSKLLLECMRRNRRPNWDAANPESCKLAKKLGYIFTESYDAYYYPPA